MSVQSEQTENAIAFLKPLFQLSTCFGILSPNLQESSSENYGKMKVYSLIFIAAMWVIYLLSLYAKVATFYFALNYFALCLDALCDLFLVLADSFVICYCTFINPKLGKSFIGMLGKREIYSSKKKRYLKRVVFHIEFGVIFTLLVCFHVYNTYAFATILTNPPFGVILRVFSHYIVVIAVYQMYNFALLIRDKYRALNKLLVSSIRRAADFNKLSENVDSYLEMYSECCDTIDAFNIIFGNQIFLSFALSF